MSLRRFLRCAVRQPILALLFVSTIVAGLGLSSSDAAGSRFASGSGAAKLPTAVSLRTAPDRQGVIVAGQLLNIRGTVQGAETAAGGGNGTSPAKAVPSGKVRVLVNGYERDGAPSAVLDASGRYELPAFALPLITDPPLAVYPLTISVAYAGDELFAPSISPTTKVAVYPSDTVTTLVTEQNPSSFAKAVTFRARVSAVAASLPTPSGAVLFEVDRAPSGGIIPLGADGNVVWNASLSIGSHVVSAIYVPVDSGFTTSQAKLTQVVALPMGRVSAGLTVMPVSLKGPAVGFRFSGRLEPPAGFPLKEACAGTVSVRLTHATSRVAKAVRLGRDCRYRLSLSFPSSAKLGSRGRVMTTTRFSGNQHILASVPIMLSVPYEPLCGGAAYSIVFIQPKSADSYARHSLCGPFSESYPPWLVVLGDSYMAGEGGRWAGNTNVLPLPIPDVFGFPSPLPNIDALGPTAYFDNLTDDLNTAPGSPLIGSHEIISHCHRSRAEEAFIKGGVRGLDLACSGATTDSSLTTGINTFFKPGIDFYSNGGNQGQALLLSQFASNPVHNVKMVVIGIGGNDYGFGDILTKCLTDYLTSWNLTASSITGTTLNFHGSLWPGDWTWDPVYGAPHDYRTYCSEDSSVTGLLNQNVTPKVVTAITNAAQALATQGYRRNDYTIVVQTAPMPVANSGEMRYGQGATFDPWSISTWFNKPRQWVGGCGFWNKDVDWIDSTALTQFNNTSKAAAITAANMNVIMLNGTTYKPRVKVLDIDDAFQGHLLCEQGVDLVEANSLNSWTSAGASDRAEWLNQIRTVSAMIPGSPYYLQEGFHPNYWGQLALRACVRLAYNHGNPIGGHCLSDGLGLDNTHNPPEPKMRLQP